MNWLEGEPNTLDSSVPDIEIVEGFVIFDGFHAEWVNGLCRFCRLGRSSQSQFCHGDDAQIVILAFVKHQSRPMFCESHLELSSMDCLALFRICAATSSSPALIMPKRGRARRGGGHSRTFRPWNRSGSSSMQKTPRPGRVSSTLQGNKESRWTHFTIV